MDRPVAWVYVVALNRAKRELRRESDAPRPDTPHPDSTGPGADPAGAVADRVLVIDALARLAPRQRAAVVLRYLADLRVSEVADAMGCSVGTAKATLHTALQRLRVTTADTDDDAGVGADKNSDPQAVLLPDDLIVEPRTFSETTRIGTSPIETSR
jgi:DNA-directed RNA polymerase specialized sigma24 family protein